MKTVRLLALSLAAGLVALAATPGSAPAAAPTNPTLTGIRAAHHPGFDRIVFQFTGGLPASRRARYVDQLIGDGSGQPIRIAGRAILRVRFAPAQAHNASGQPTVAGRKTFALPNIMTAVRSGDFEAVTSYGIGLAKRTSFHVSALRNPSRVVVDVKAAFPTVNRRVFFFNSRHFTANQPPFFSPRLRPVRTTTPATGLMDRLFAGVLPGEHADGLRLLRSDATGFSHLSIGNRIARVRLTGGCNSHGSTVTIAGEIMPTLRQLRSVDWVKIYDPAGHTEHPAGPTDSIPTCLEP